jgi:2-polyprenyl-3-methyl-5-hydroxy-6-metoxy-1,4-benzoquinol methylase
MSNAAQLSRETESMLTEVVAADVHGENNIWSILVTDEAKMDAKSHWEGVYRAKKPTELSWYKPHLELSLQLIEEAAPARDARIIDVGGGESTLVDDLVQRGYTDVDVLDLSATALEVSARRLGVSASKVQWIQGDVLTVPMQAREYDVWHDRAVFHFLTEIDQRAAYVRQVAHAVKPGGHVIVATFGPARPSRCSGLDVVRYDADALHDQFGPRFALVKQLSERHRTPSGAVQQFVYWFCALAH